ncbi:MAG: sulfatase [Victivallales bacterium]|jgi:arylsulfatase A-like enzyme
MNSKNIIYLHSHDTGRYISPYGFKVRTPNLEEFAKDGVVFRNCFCASPTCSPSRAALLTGQYPHSCGMLGLAHRGFSMANPSAHLANTLRNIGYHTCLLGIQHESDDAKILGYDETVENRDTPWEIDELVPLAESFFSRRHDKPFFLSIGSFEAHRPFPNPDIEDDPRWLRPVPILPDTPEIRYDMATLNTSINRFDRGVGKIMAALDNSELKDETLIIITSDHGLAFPRMKCNLTDHGIGVMLMMRGAGLCNGGRVVDSLVSHVDIFPTLCDYLEIPRNERLQGVSLFPILTGQSDSVRDEIFAEINAHVAYEPMRCIRTHRHKYIRHLLENSHNLVMANCDESPSKDFLITHSWNAQEIVKEELFDLYFDPQECHNLVNDPDKSGILNNLRERLDAWMLETNDPALKYGRPPVPESAILNEQQDISPDKSPAKIDKNFMLRNEIPELVN